MDSNNVVTKASMHVGDIHTHCTLVFHFFSNEEVKQNEYKKIPRPTGQ